MKEPCSTDAEGCPRTLTREPLSADEAAGLSKILKALAEPARLRLVSLIASHEGGEACACDLASCFDLTQPTISHHLKVLREAGVLTSERRATWIYYSVVPEVMASLSELFGSIPLAAAR